MASSSSSPPSASSESNKDGRNSLLTFGIELEFVVAYLGKDQPDPHPQDNRKVYISDKHPDAIRTLPSLMGLMILNNWENLPPEITQELTERSITNVEEVRDKILLNPQYGTDTFEPGAYQNIRYRIARFLRDHKVPAISDSIDKDTMALIKRSLKDAGTHVDVDQDHGTKAAGSRYSNWDVNTDDSIGEMETKEYHWAKIEVTSPVLPFTRESLELVRYVVNLLQSEYRILVNHSMMMHVHVGRGSQGFSLTELHAITALLYAAAPRIDQLHPIWCGPLVMWAPGARTQSLMVNLDKEGIKEAIRQSKAPGPGNPLLTTETDMDDDVSGVIGVSDTEIPYWRPTQQIRAHELLQRWSGHQQANAFGVARIWQTTTLDELYECLSTVYLDPKKHSYHFRPAYNFRNLVAKPVVKQTVEFRQHCGTMSPDAIINWISVAAGLCSFCVNTPFREGLDPVMQKLEHLDPNSATSWGMYKDIPNEHVINPTLLLYGRQGDSYSVYDLLRDLGLAPQAEYYQKRGLHALPPDYFTIRDIDADYGLEPASDSGEENDGEEKKEEKEAKEEDDDDDDNKDDDSKGDKDEGGNADDNDNSSSTGGQ